MEKLQILIVALFISLTICALTSFHVARADGTEVNQPITVTMNNAAPAATVTVTDLTNPGYPSPSTFSSDGTLQTITGMDAGDQFTLSFSNVVNVQDGFNVAGTFSQTSQTYAASNTELDVTAIEQVQNTFSVSGVSGSDSVTLSSTNLGASTPIVLNSAGSFSATVWTDYGTAVTFPASSDMSTTTERWSIGTAYSTVDLTAGRNTYSQTYSHQYSFQLDYSVSGGGSGYSAPTLTATQFGSPYTPTLSASLSIYWLDSGQSWSATNPLVGSGVNERWDARQTVSGTVSSSSPTTAGTGTLTFTYYHQFYLTVNGGNSITFGTASPTGDQWYDSSTSTTVSSSGIYNRAGGSGTRVSSWNLDGGTNTNVATTDTVTTSSILMSTYHTVNFNSVTQYQVTLDSAAALALSSITSPTISGDNYWYDSGTSVSVVLNGIWGRGGGAGNRLTGYVLNGGSNNPTSTTSTVSVYSGAISNHEFITATSVTQYFLTVSGGNGIAYGTASTISGDTGWYDSGTSTTVSSNWVWNTVSGQSRTAITNYAIDGTNQNPTRSNTGTLTTLSVTMSAPQTVAFSSTTQYYLTVTGGNGVAYGTASPTSDNWYDSGSTTTVSSNWVWNAVSGQSRTAITNWQLDGTNQNPSRSNTGRLTTSPISMSTYYTVNFVSTTQYYLTVTGGNSITFGTTSPTGDQWYDSGTSTTVSSNWVWATAGSTRTALTNWNLNGGSNQNPTRADTGTLTTSPVAMSTYNTVNFISTTQFLLTDTTISGSENSITLSQTSDSWYDSGTNVNVVLNNIWGISGGSRSNLVSYTVDTTTTIVSRTGSGTVSVPTITMSTPHSVSDAAQTQYQLTLSYSVNGVAGSGYSAPTFTANQFGSLYGQTLTTSAVGYWFDAGSSWTETNLLLGSGATERWQTNQAISGSISSAQTIVFTYYNQYQVTTRYSASDASTPSSSVTLSGTQFGANSYTLTLTTSGQKTWLDFATLWLVNNPIIASANERWYAGSGTFGTVTGAITIAPMYYHQYLVTFQYTVSGGGSPTAPTAYYSQFGEALTKSTATDTSVSDWADAGTAVSYSNPLGGSDGSERWQTNLAVTAGQSTVAASVSSGTPPIDPTYYNQFQMTLQYNIVNSPAGTPTVTNIVSYNSFGSGGLMSTPALAPATTSTVWADSGSSVTYVSPITSGSERWMVTSGDSGTYIAVSSVSAAATLNPEYYHQFQVTASYSTSDGSTPSSAVVLTGITFGSGSTPTLTRSAQQVWLDAGSSWSVNNPITSGTQRWDATSGTSGTVTGAITIVSSYYHQYQVTFAVSPSGSGSTSPVGINVWENAGSLSISATANNGYMFSTWSSNTGLITFNMQTPSATATISGSGIITSNFLTTLSHFVFNTVASQTAGTSFSVTITAVDSSGNTVTSYSGTPTLTYSTGSITPSSTSGGFSNGVWTGSITVTTAGSSVTLSVDDGSGHTGRSNSFTVSHAAAASSVAISPADSSVTAGLSETYSATASDTYGNSWDVTSLMTWSISSGAGGSWSSNVYTSANPGSWTVTGTYASTAYTTGLTVNPTITASAGANGAISPSGSVSVNYGDNQTFTITANAGYYIVDVTVNGTSVGAVSSYIFTNVQAAYTISATFAATPTPTPSPSPSPTATPTPSPAPTPIPTATPIPTIIPSPTPTPSTTKSSTLSLGIVLIAVTTAAEIIVIFTVIAIKRLRRKS